MTDRLSTRITSFALATIVTWSLCAGIDTLALGQHAGGPQMSQATAATVVATSPSPASPS
ncbi:MAG TPA: hypothetical protein VIV84_07735 [Burkholderiaceae bacterium]|jgi:hypothetical protein